MVFFDNQMSKTTLLPLVAGQKIIGAMSRPIGRVTDLWLLANPLMAHDIGG
jgi:ABC-type transport system involved in cytochrome c biogenesis ATPase subunit